MAILRKYIDFSFFFLLAQFKNRVEFQRYSKPLNSTDFGILNVQHYPNLPYSGYTKILSHICSRYSHFVLLNSSATLDPVPSACVKGFTANYITLGATPKHPSFKNPGAPPGPVSYLY